MNALVTLTTQTIECNKMEIECMKIKRDSIISDLSDIHSKIDNAIKANIQLERELSLYMNQSPVKKSCDSYSDKQMNEVNIQDNGPNKRRSITD